MSRENVELTRRGFEAFNQDGVKSFTNPDLWSPEIVSISLRPVFRGSACIAGYDAVRRCFEEDWFAAFPFEEWQVEVEELRPRGSGDLDLPSAGSGHDQRGGGGA